MDNKKQFFQDMVEIYQKFYYPQANQGPVTMAEIGTLIQTNGRGSDEWMYGVACAFISLAGEDLKLFCKAYLSKQDKSSRLTKKEDDMLKGRGRVFWQKVKKGGKYTEFLHAQECKRRRDLG